METKVVRILVIDDDSDVLEVIGKILKLAGHSVELLDGGAAGLARLKATTFDVLLTDVLMPDTDGIEVIKNLRRSDPNLWVVAMSGGSKRLPANVVLKMTEAFGADRVLMKPFQRADLLAAIARG
jgi:CheY-like chemotaxis protein